MKNDTDCLASSMDHAMHDLFGGLKQLFLEEMESIGVKLQSDYTNYSADDGYSAPVPSFDLDVNDRPFGVADPAIASGTEELEKENKEFLIDMIQPAAQTGYSTCYGDILIRRVPRYSLGYRVLGRAFPLMKRIEIASDLYGQDFEEVKTHEIIHVRHPELSEADVRRRTRQSLSFSARFN